MSLLLHHEEFMEGSEAAALIGAGVGILATGMVTPVGAWLVTAQRIPCALARPLLTPIAFGIWGVTWWGLRRRWQGGSLPAKRIVLITGGLILAGLLLGSPLIARLFPTLMLP